MRSCNMRVPEVLVAQHMRIFDKHFSNQSPPFSVQSSFNTHPCRGVQFGKSGRGLKLLKLRLVRRGPWPCEKSAAELLFSTVILNALSILQCASIWELNVVAEVKPNPWKSLWHLGWMGTWLSVVLAGARLLDLGGHIIDQPRDHASFRQAIKSVSSSGMQQAVCYPRPYGCRILSTWRTSFWHIF